MTDIFKILANHRARLEVLIAELLSLRKLNLNDIFFILKSNFQRGYNRDVLKVSSEDEITKVEISRNGLYDLLPEMSVHQPENANPFKTLERMEKESEKVREEEKEARKFFQPFEQELVRQRIIIERKERELLSEHANILQKDLFNTVWQVVKPYENNAKSLIFYFLPLAHKIAGDTELMEECFRLVLQENVKIFKKYMKKIVESDHCIPILGETEIGIDFVFGGGVEDGLPTLRFEIGPIELHNVSDYLPGERGMKVLNMLFSYFVPLEMDIEVEFLLKDTTTSFILQEGKNLSRLGYSTFLN